MRKRKSIIRVKPKSFDTDWREDLQSVGVHVPEKVSTVSYTPVNHSPMPYSVDIDLNTKTMVKRTVGVMPNATYQGHIYSWEEFCALIDFQKTNVD